MENSTLRLKEQAKRLRVSNIASVVLDDSRFDTWSGSGKPEQHHYGTFGLRDHTLEVMNLCFNAVKTLEIEVDEKELFLSVLFHDAGKMYDYEIKNDGYWGSADHKKLIHHISRSAVIWTEACIKYKSYEHIKDAVLHNILSHHGLREWGSPVRPQSKVAWVLHLCDTMSARINELSM